MAAATRPPSQGIVCESDVLFYDGQWERGLALLALRSDLLTIAAQAIEIIVLHPARVAHCIEGLRKTGLRTAC